MLFRSRGRNYAEKVKGRFESPPKSWNALSGEKLSALLPEDYVTCLAEDDAGRLWIGSRQQGFSVIDTKSGVSFHGTKDTAGLKDSFVTVIQPDSTGRALVGTYGGGLVHLKDSFPMPIVKSTAVKPQPMSRPIAPHPAPAATPSLTDLQRLASILKSLKDPLPTASGSFLGDDWKTQGDWVGRIGRQYTILCAMAAPLAIAAAPIASAPPSMSRRVICAFSSFPSEFMKASIQNGLRPIVTPSRPPKIAGPAVELTPFTISP